MTTVDRILVWILFILIGATCAAVILALSSRHAYGGETISAGATGVFAYWAFPDDQDCYTGCSVHYYPPGASFEAIGALRERGRVYYVANFEGQTVVIPQYQIHPFIGYGR